MLVMIWSGRRPIAALMGMDIDVSVHSYELIATILSMRGFLLPYQMV
jgi:hypothetical protein